MSIRAFGIISIVLNVLFVSTIFGEGFLSSISIIKLPFVATRVQNANFDRDIIINFMPLRERIRSFIDSQDVPVGVYFEYLPTGISVGVGEKDAYIYASLLKVPLAMAVFELVDRGDIQLDKNLEVLEDDLDAAFGTDWMRGAHAHITVREAVERMLIYSDNTMYALLMRTSLLISDSIMLHVFDSLDIPTHVSEDKAYVTPKNYSSILKSLYFSSLLPLSFSNEILSILTRSPFTQYIVAGVASGVPVAHKVGVYEDDKPGISTFSDCGIVYVPRRPYILCVMMHGTQKDALQIMPGVSSLVYDFVSNPVSHDLKE